MSRSFRGKKRPRTEALPTRSPAWLRPADRRWTSKTNAKGLRPEPFSYDVVSWRCYSESSTAQDMTVVHSPSLPSADCVRLNDLKIFPLAL